MTQIRIGVVGLGVISRFYLAALDQLKTLHLSALCDLRPEVLDPFRDQVECYDNHHEMLAHAALDAVVINTPNDAHLTICQDVIKAGLPVCVEKPLCIGVQNGRELVRLARAGDVHLFTAFHRRYNDNVLALLRGLPADVPIRSVTVRYLERIQEHAGTDSWYLDPERCGGGCVADNGPNAFDLARLFLGEVELVGARVVRDERGIDQQASVTLRAVSGATARVELDWNYPGETKDVRVELADGSVHTADMLAGHAEFKGSLWHEYVGVLEDFAFMTASGRHREGDGLAALELVDAVYAQERAALPGTGAVR